MFSRFSKIVIICLVASALVLPELFILADMSPAEERAALEEELRRLEEEIAHYDQEIGKTAEEKETLQNRIYILRNTIQKLEAQINQSNIVINDLALQINDTEESIEDTILEIEKAKDRLALILRTVNEEDQRPLLGILLSEGFSEFFENLAALEALNIDNQKLLDDIKSLKEYLENQKKNLDEEKDSTEKQVALQTLQKQQSTAARQEVEELLKITETEYQRIIKEKENTQLQAQQIRSRIFELIGVPDAPTFGEAYEIAKYVESVTGVRPALLLAVLTQESNLGKNVGQCYLKDPETGSGVVAYNGREVDNVMKPMGLGGRKGDVEDFIAITTALGRDPCSTPISCPMSYGYGGAMGPAQVIPTTWVLFRDKVFEITGQEPDPWNIKDAFLAAGLYLKNGGAAKQDYNSEFNAVMSYFAGGGWSWSSYKEIYMRDYGYPVMRIAANYTVEIAELEK